MRINRGGTNRQGCFHAGRRRRKTPTEQTGYGKEKRSDGISGIKRPVEDAEIGAAVVRTGFRRAAADA